MECLWAVDQMRRTFEDIIFGFELVCKISENVDQSINGARWNFCWCLKSVKLVDSISELTLAKRGSGAASMCSSDSLTS